MTDDQAHPPYEFDLTEDQRRVFSRTKERMVGAGNYEHIDDTVIMLFAVTIVHWRDWREVVRGLPPHQRTDEFRALVEEERVSARHLAAQLFLIDPAREHFAALDADGADGDLARLLE